MEHDTEMGRLTNKIIENLPVQSKGYILWDSETKGFGIRININGKKTFRVLASFEKSLNQLAVPVAQQDRAPDS